MISVRGHLGSFQKQKVPDGLERFVITLVMARDTVWRIYKTRCRAKENQEREERPQGDTTNNRCA